MKAEFASLHSLTDSAYRWYASPEAVRADDQLVRSLASVGLCQTASGLRTAEAQVRHALPHPTRENPFPAADAAHQLERLRRLHARVLALETRLRGAPCLPDHDFSATEGVGAALRDRLVRCDAALLAATESVASLPPDDLETRLDAIETMIDARAATMRATVR